MTRIPKLLHYCFGFDESFGGQPWSLVHYVCVKSAVERLRPDGAFVYFDHEPSGPWWELSRKLLTPVRISAPRHIFGKPLVHPAHRADVVRLETLIREGGIYLDTDVFVHNSFDHLLNNSVVLGQEGIDAEYGLANAVILAERGAPFLKRWYEEYRWFRSTGHDAYWSEHSVRVPSALAKAFPSEVTILPHTAFYWPLWRPKDLELIFKVDSDIEHWALATHLWESQSWRYLEHLTPGIVRRIECSFHRWARPIVVDFDDNFGRPGLVERTNIAIRRHARHLREYSDDISIKARRAKELGFQGSLSRVRRRVVSKMFRKRFRRDVFRDVYDRQLWGASKTERFYSGVGSRGVAADTYVNQMSALLKQHVSGMTAPPRVVDLGCGDFKIGRGLVTSVKEINYIGCDIVPELIAYNRQENSDPRVSFECVDIVCDELPDGEVCLVRQVLQHLSNQEIGMVILKLRKFPRIYVTEGYPAERFGATNPDKETDHEVRFDWRNGRGRGVELDRAPFHVPTRELFRVCTDDKNVIVTFELVR